MNREAEQRALAASDRWSLGDRLIFFSWQNWLDGKVPHAVTGEDGGNLVVQIVKFADVA
jgi:hypothetical protein